MRRLCSRTPTQSTCMRCTSSSSSSSSSNRIVLIIQSCTTNSHHPSFPAHFPKHPTSPPIKSPKHLRVSSPPSNPPSVLAVERNNAFMVIILFHSTAGYSRDSIMPRPHYLSLSASNISSNSPSPSQLTTFTNGTHHSAFPSCAKVISPLDDPACHGVLSFAVSVLSAT